LEEYNRIALVNAGVELVEQTQHGHPVLYNVPNHLLNQDTLHDARYPLPGTNQPSYALVSQAGPGVTAWLQRSGFDGFVLRTPNLGRLATGIREALAGRSWPSRSEIAAVPRQTRHYTKQRHVLAVDDQAINLSLLNRFFQYLGIVGTFARSCDEAVDRAKERKFDLILLDLHMPDHDGFETVRRLREIVGSNSSVPILAMTADAFASTQKRALEAGFDAVLTKPATVEQVGEAVEYWVVSPDSARDQLALNGETGRALPNKQESIAQNDGDWLSDQEPSNYQAGFSPLEVKVSVVACAVASLADEDWALDTLATYASEVPAHVLELETALKSGDCKRIAERAHALKGVSYVCRIEAAVQSSRRVEQACRERNWQNIEAAVQQLTCVLREAAKQCQSLSASTA